jgi:hypothetical protein
VRREVNNYFTKVKTGKGKSIASAANRAAHREQYQSHRYGALFEQKKYRITSPATACALFSFHSEHCERGPRRSATREDAPSTMSILFERMLTIDEAAERYVPGDTLTIASINRFKRALQASATQPYMPSQPVRLPPALFDKAKAAGLDLTGYLRD